MASENTTQLDLGLMLREAFKTACGLVLQQEEGTLHLVRIGWAKTHGYSGVLGGPNAPLPFFAVNFKGQEPVEISFKDFPLRNPPNEIRLENNHVVQWKRRREGQECVAVHGNRGSNSVAVMKPVALEAGELLNTPGLPSLSVWGEYDKQGKISGCKLNLLIDGTYAKGLVGESLLSERLAFERDDKHDFWQVADKKNGNVERFSELGIKMEHLGPLTWEKYGYTQMDLIIEKNKFARREVQVKFPNTIDLQKMSALASLGRMMVLE